MRHTELKIASLIADMSSMETSEVIRAYVDRACSLSELHSRLQEQTWGHPSDDALAMDARRLIGEATSADWPEEGLRDELARLLGRYDDLGRMQEALKDALQDLVMVSGQASATPWSVEVRMERHDWITTEKTRDQTGAPVPLG